MHMNMHMYARVCADCDSAKIFHGYKQDGVELGQNTTVFSETKIKKHNTLHQNLQKLVW